MKPDEREFLLAVYRRRKNCRDPRLDLEGEFATDTAARLGIHPKRAAYLLEKWSGRGWWECGVSLRAGWLTEAGLKAAEEMAQ